MPVKKCSNGKWRIGSGKCMYDTKEDAEKAMQGWKASESMAEAKSRLTEKKSTVKVTRGMANHVGRVKLTCPECGLKIAQYVGRYPRSCPTCGAELPKKKKQESSLREKVEGLIQEISAGKSSSDKAAVSLLSPASKKAGYMNAIMRKVNASEMIDYYVGYSEDESSALRPTWIKLMFSRHTPKEAVGELARDLDKVAAKISLDKGGDQEKPLWVITLSQPRISDEPMMQGDVGVGVDMAGQV